MQNVKIRNAQFRDYQSLSGIFRLANALHVELRPDLYREVQKPIPKKLFLLGVLARDYLHYEPELLKVAECDGQVVGAVHVESKYRTRLSWSAFPSEAYLDNICVLPEFRQKGIGSLLLKDAQIWSRNKGHQHMWAKILPENETSLAFFKNASFKTDGINMGLRL